LKSFYPEISVETIAERLREDVLRFSCSGIAAVDDELQSPAVAAEPAGEDADIMMRPVRSMIKIIRQVFARLFS